MNDAPKFGLGGSIALALAWTLGTTLGIYLVVFARFSRDVPDETVRVYDPAADRWAIVDGLEGSSLEPEASGSVLVASVGGDTARWTPSVGAIEHPVAHVPPPDVLSPPGTFGDLLDAATPGGPRVTLWFMRTADHVETTMIYRRDGATARAVAEPFELPTLQTAVVALDATGDRLLLVDGACAATLVAGGAKAAAAPTLPWSGGCSGLALTVLASGEVFGVRGRDVFAWDPASGQSSRRADLPVEATVQPSLAPLHDGRVAVAGVGAWTSRTSPGGVMSFGIGVLLLLGAAASAVRGAHRLQVGWAALGVALGGLLVGVVYLFMVISTASGRPLRVGGRELLPRLGRARARRAPASTGRRASAPGPLTRLVARRFWLRAARLEASSVPTFERLAAELAAVGAPARLARRARAAARDETRHAALCLALAARIDGREHTLDDAWLGATEVARAAAVAARPQVDRATLAREALIEGVHGEGLAARIARRSARAAGPDARRALRVIARDEARHARLAREVLGWCLRTGGAPVARAVADGLEAIAKTRPLRGSRRLPRALRRLGLFAEARPGALDAAVRRGLRRHMAAQGLQYPSRPSTLHWTSDARPPLAG